MLSTRLQKQGIIIFLLLVFSPLTGHILDLGRSTSELENRPLAHFPSIPSNWPEVQELPSQIDKYFKDNFGLKRIVTSAHAQIMYYAFSKSPSSQISIGKDSYLFFNSHDSKKPNSHLEKICISDQSSKLDMQDLYKAMHSIDHYMNSKSIEAYFIIVPTKSKIYPGKLPDNLPAKLKKACAEASPGPMGQLYRMYSDKQIVKEKLYYPLELFRAQKNKFEIYQKNRFHWIGESPHLVAREFLLNYASIDTLPNVTSETSVGITDLYKLLNGVRPFSKYRKYNYKEAGINFCRGVECYPAIKDYLSSVPGMSYATNKNVKGRNAIILSDSFGAFISPAIAMGYEHMLHVNMSHVKKNKLQSFLDKVTSLFSNTSLIFVFHDGAIPHGLTSLANSVEIAAIDKDAKLVSFPVE